MDTFQAIYERRSARVFEKGKPISEDVEGKILDSARRVISTPTGDYPWRFIVVRDESVKRMIADCAQEVAKTMFGASYELFSEHLWYMPLESRLRVAEYSTTGELWRYPEDCALLIIPVLCKTDWACGLGGLVRRHELLAAYQGFACQNMWLVASAFGIGAAYNSMPVVDVRRREIIGSYLGIPSSWDASGAFAFGYSPTVRASGPSRPALEAITFSEYWGNPWVRSAFRGGKGNTEVPSRDILQVMRNPNLVQSFGKGKIDDWTMERIVDVALWGPVPENFKQWRYIVIRDQASKEFLYKVASEKEHTSFYWNDPEWQMARLWNLKEGDRLAQLEEVMERGIGKWYTQADALIIVLAGQRWADSPQYENLIAARNPVPHIATGCCVQNMMLAATALGLGFNFDPTPISDLRNEETVCEYFGIPRSWIPLGILGLGKPGEAAERSPLPSLENLVFDEYWGNPYRGRKFEI